MTKQNASDQSANLERLIAKLDSLAEAIRVLAQSNSDLVQALMDIADEVEAETPGVYLDGAKAQR
jgi:uncharacterized membrane protein